MRQKPVSIEVRKSGQHWAVLAEEHTIAQVVHEKGAHILEAVLRGLLRYTSRKLFRLAVSEGMKGPKPVEAAKEPKAGKPKAPATGKDKPKAKVAGKKPAVKKEKAADDNPEPIAGPTDSPVPQADQTTQS